MNITFDERVTDWTEDMDERKDGSRFNRTAADGAAWWHKNQFGELAHLTWCCACGCKEVRTIPVKNSHSNYGWDFDGNEKLPTTQPSIFAQNGCRWHGYLTKGVFSKC